MPLAPRKLPCLTFSKAQADAYIKQVMKSRPTPAELRFMDPANQSNAVATSYQVLGMTSCALLASRQDIFEAKNKLRAVLLVAGLATGDSAITRLPPSKVFVHSD